MRLSFFLCSLKIAAILIIFHSICKHYLAHAKQILLRIYFTANPGWIEHAVVLAFHLEFS
ncbi:MAG: hypothetical protein DWQ10_05125 [Calditrichaeota bacterium]|nr:MAG: hypothetical protein DWQ10_05125 [Calditrichota bacterium]